MTQTLHDDDGYRAYLSNLANYEPLDAKTERKLADRYRKNGDASAAHRLVCSNLRFVVKIANGYRNYGLRIADLVEEGNLGLLEAIRRFEPERGLRFMTYAAYWVRAYILAHVLKQRNLVGVGTGPLQSKMFFRLARERARLTAVLGDNPATINERLAETFGTTVERVREMAGRIEGRDVSLDAEIFDDGSATGLDLLTAGGIDAEEQCADAEREHLVRSRVALAMQALNPRERYIVEHRLLADEEDTLAEIGKELGISRERVRQIEERVKEKLHGHLADLVGEGDPLPVLAAA